MDKPIHKLGLIAGAGQLPHRLLAAAHSQNIDTVAIGITGNTDADLFAHHPQHRWLEINEIVRTLEIFKQEGVSHILMAGKLSRPALSSLRPPLLAAKIVARIGKAMFAGDDALFTAITSIFEDEGFTVLGADDLLDDLLTPEGCLTTTQPSAQAQADIDQGFATLAELGKLDIGQGLVINRGQILAVEAMEGTDAMLSRCRGLGSYVQEAGGVLIKAKKQGQERRVDLPAIGVQTITAVSEAGLAGIAIQTEHSLIIDRDAMIDAANKAGLFVVGVKAGVA